MICDVLQPIVEPMRGGYLRVLFTLFLTGFLVSCGPETVDEPTVPAFATIQDVKYNGPGAYCADITALLANPPSDMTEKQNLIATLSQDACQLPSNDISVTDVQTGLAGEKLAYQVDGDTLTVFAKYNKETARACCSIQTSLQLIGQESDLNYFASRFHLKNLDAARLEFFAPDYFENDDKVKLFYEGPEAFPDREMNTDELNGILTERVFESTTLGEKRIYDLYVPQWFEPGDDVGLVVLGDGVSLGFHVREWEPLIASGKLTPFVAIGVRSGRRAISEPAKDYDFDVRNSDYIHGYTKGPQRFDAHLRFVTDELMPAIKDELAISPDPEATVLIGGSSAGSFALWGVMKRPDVFGVSVGTSPSGPIPDAISDLAARRSYYISAGIYEPGFLYNAVSYEKVLRQAGAQVDLETYSDGHSVDHRAQRMVEVLPHIFPPKN